jgi:AcrR family transcriptional regulator
MKTRIDTREYKQTARAQAAEATGERIVESFLERLMEEWFDEIRLERVAADAGVTVMTVVRRFGGKDGLLAEGARRMGQRINAKRASPAGNVEKLVAGLMADYEETGDAVIRLLALEPRHEAVKECVTFGRGEHRRWVSEGFAGALAGLSAKQRERAIDALVVCTDVYTWKLLRRDMGRSVKEAAESIRGMIDSTLNGITNFDS